MVQQIQVYINSSYTEVDKNNGTTDPSIHYYECVNGSWTARGGCKVAVIYMSPRNNATTTKYFDNGQSITCSYGTFGISDPDSGTAKVCKVNGYIVAKDSETFKIDMSVKAHKYCHGSMIPYDLIGNASGTVYINGYTALTKDTKKAELASVNGSLIHNGSATGASYYGNVICQSNGKWKLGSGTATFTQSSTISSFKIPNTAKSLSKSFNVELWGAQGGGSAGANGGYTKLVSQLGNKFNDGTVLYVVVGERKSSGYNTSYNGGGSSWSNGNCSGGGATHIATKTGVLSSLSGSKSSVIAVAGGGGGTGENGNAGGSGGGANMNGGDGVGGNWRGKGGTTTTPGSISCDGCGAGSFGKGGHGGGNIGTSGKFCGGGGAAGYWGGSGADWGEIGNSGGGGGGSGYCNTSYGTCSGSNGARSGNGYAKISW